MAPADNHGGTAGALVPAEEQRPQFTAEDLALIDSSGYVDGDDDTIEAARNAISSGLFTPEQARKHWSLTDQEFAEATSSRPRPRQPAALAAIDAELAEIKALRKLDRRRYWSPEVQAREAELIAKAERLKALPAHAREAAVDSNLPPALQERWQNQPGGVQGALDAISRRATIAFDGADQEAIDDLKAAFDGDLDEAIQIEVADVLAQGGGGRWPKASAVDIAEFRETSHGQALLEEWGDKGPALLGIARHEALAIWGTLTESSRLKLNRWIDARPLAQRESIIKLLVARAAKRTLVQAAGR